MRSPIRPSPTCQQYLTSLSISLCSVCQLHWNWLVLSRKAKGCICIYCKTIITTACADHSSFGSQSFAGLNTVLHLDRRTTGATAPKYISYFRTDSRRRSCKVQYADHMILLLVYCVVSWWWLFYWICWFLRVTFSSAHKKYVTSFTKILFIGCLSFPSQKWRSSPTVTVSNLLPKTQPNWKKNPISNYPMSNIWYALGNFPLDSWHYSLASATVECLSRCEFQLVPLSYHLVR